MPFVPVARVDAIPSDRGLRVIVAPAAIRADRSEQEENEAERASAASTEPTPGIAIGLYRAGDQIFAMEDACPHAGFPLSRGQFKDCVVVCDAHGWPFDVRTGFDPENADGFPIPCFEVRVVGDMVEVDLASRTNDPRPYQKGS